MDCLLVNFFFIISFLNKYSIIKIMNICCLCEFWSSECCIRSKICEVNFYSKVYFLNPLTTINNMIFFSLNYGPKKSFLAIISKKGQIRFIQNYTQAQWTFTNPKMQISLPHFFFLNPMQHKFVKCKNLRKSSTVFKCESDIYYYMYFYYVLCKQKKII